MAKSFFENFTRWQYYVHYIILGTALAFVAKNFGAPIDLTMTLQLIGAVFAIDVAIHGVFWALPKPWRWRD